MSLLDNLKKIASELSLRRKYVHGDKGLLENPHNKLKQWQPEGFVKKSGKVVGLGAIDLSWFLFCLGKFGLKDTKNGLNTVFLDNALLDKWKKDKQNIKIKDTDSGFKQFFKNLQKSNPRTASVLQLWMVYVLLFLSIAGGVKVVKNKDNIKQTLKEWFQDKEIDKEIEEEIDNEKQNTFAAYQEKLQSITPWLIAELIAAEGVHMNEQGLHTPYKDGNGIWTIGFGSTRLKDGRAVTKNTPPITTEEAYELARWHLEEHETYFDLYCYSVADKSLSVQNTGEAFGLASVIYNSGTKFIEDEHDRNHKERFTLLRNEYKAYGVAIPDSVVANLFKKYPIRKKASFGQAWMDSHKPQDMAKAIGLYMKDGRGMHWRRWLEAGLITGDINPSDLLDCPIKGMYDFYLYMGGKKQSLWEKTKSGEWQPKKSTYTEFKQWLANPNVNRQKVKDYLPSDILQECLNGQCEIGVVQPKRKIAEQIDKQLYVMGYEDNYKYAMDNYAQGNYQEAINILEKLSIENPNNALLHNDLAVAYNKIGEYEKAIEHARKVVYEIGDKDQYGAAQYNAGVAYEKLGNMDKALQNYKLSLSNGNSAARDAIKRVKKQLKKQKSKTIAFNDAVKKLQTIQNRENNINVYPLDNEYQA